MTEQLDYPPGLVTRADGTVTFATVELDSDEDIRASISALCDVRPRQLAWNRKRGTPSILGEQDRDLAAARVQAALDTQEVRGRAAVSVIDDPTVPGGRSIRLKLVMP